MARWATQQQREHREGEDVQSIRAGLRELGCDAPCALRADDELVRATNRAERPGMQCVWTTRQERTVGLAPPASLPRWRYSFNRPVRQ